MIIDNDLNAFSALFASYSTFTSLFSITLAVLAIVGMWKVFEKANEEGWKAIIPIYNGYILAKIAGAKKIWIAQFIVTLIYFPVAIGFFAYCVMGVFGSISAETISMVDFGMGILGFGILMFVLTIVILVFNIIIYARLAKSFGKSGWFAVGLVLFGQIFLMILGFDSSQYIGPNGVPEYAPIEGYNNQI